jgi:putative sigma-54 modulation protein
MENIKIVARHMKITNAISDYIHKKIGAMEKYLHNIVSTQVILEIDKYRHNVEIIMHSNKKIFKIKEVDKDLYAAIDKAAERIKELLIRHKDKIVSLKKHRKKISEIFVSEEKESSLSSVEETVVYAQEMSKEDAVKMFLEGNDIFLIFIDKETKKNCIIYKQNDITKLAVIEK